MKSWVCTLVSHRQGNILTGIRKKYFAFPVLPMPPVKQRPLTCEILQFKKIFRLTSLIFHTIFQNFKISDVWDLINSLSVPPLSLFLSLSLTVYLSHGRTQDHPFKGLLHQATSVPWGACTDRAAGIEVRDRRKSLCCFFLSDDETLQGFLWHPRYSLLCLMTKPCLQKITVKGFLFLWRFLSMTRQNLKMPFRCTRLHSVQRRREEKKRRGLFCFDFLQLAGLLPILDETGAA